MNRFEKAQISRQRILDMLNDQGEMSMVQILAEFGGMKQTLNSILLRMIHVGDIKRSGQPFMYSAIEKVTVSASDIAVRSKTPGPRRSTPGHIVHLMSDTTPKPSHPGQTSRSRPRSGTVLEMTA